MYCYWFIGNSDSRTKFIELFQSLSYSLYQWRPDKLALLSSGGSDHVFLIIDDFKKFYEKEKDFLVFQRDLAEYKNLSFLFLSHSYQVEYPFFLKRFLKTLDYKFFVIQSEIPKQEISYSYYLGSYRDWLYGFLRKRRGENIALVVPDYWLKNELAYWRGEYFKAAFFEKKSDVDVWILNESQAKICSPQTVFYHPLVKDRSWDFNDQVNEVFLHTGFFKFMLSSPMNAFAKLGPFYRYRLL